MFGSLNQRLAGLQSIQSVGSMGVVITSTASGMGSNMPGGITPINRNANYRWSTTTTTTASAPQSYYVQLPEHPVVGDTITVYYDGIKWLETQNISQGRVVDPSQPSGFTLKELEEAQKIMDDCGAV